MRNSGGDSANLVAVGQARRQYQAPQLSVFGKIAALTQSSAGCNKSDNSGCTTGGTGNTMGPMASDRNVKEDVVRIGRHPLGFGLYLFRYKPEFRDEWGHGRQFGVMADEVEAVMPEAVRRHADGYRIVDLSMLGIARIVQ
jgi:hypothetical protein